MDWPQRARRLVESTICDPSGMTTDEILRMLAPCGLLEIVSWNRRIYRRHDGHYDITDGAGDDVLLQRITPAELQAWLEQQLAFWRAVRPLLEGEAY